MSFGLAALEDAVSRYDRVAIAAVADSSPPEVATAIPVWNGGRSGTIDGGAPEHLAEARAPSHRGPETPCPRSRHEIDLALCHALAHRGFGLGGPIGSDRKRTRFRRRLRDIGHKDARIARICCLIGQKSLANHPQAIAVGVARQILRLQNDRDGATWQTHSSAFGG